MNDQFVAVKHFKNLFTKDPRFSLKDDRLSTGRNCELVFFYPEQQITIYVYIYIYRVYQEERTRLREDVPYVKL
jgi:hypothetical protein